MNVPCIESQKVFAQQCFLMVAFDFYNETSPTPNSFLTLGAADLYLCNFVEKKLRRNWWTQQFDLSSWGATSAEKSQNIFIKRRQNSYLCINTFLNWKW